MEVTVWRERIKQKTTKRATINTLLAVVGVSAFFASKKIIEKRRVHNRQTFTCEDEKGI